MELGFFTMPIHPLEKDWRVCLARRSMVLLTEKVMPAVNSAEALETRTAQ